MKYYHIRHPIRTYREWKEKERYKCVVQIDYPRMRIKGKARINLLDDPEFPIFYAFFGIPYALPPTGPLRFKPPQPLPTPRKPRNPLWKAYHSDNACIQHYKTLEMSRGSEDCLYLNIYLLKKPEEMGVKKPVLVYIHGGGFHHGSGDITDIRPDAIIRENIVFVTVNYRLNIFGFLNMRNEECRGNAGLKDQTAALRWVKANIDRFGGDPNNVTISGHSAGATCVNLHMISPLSKGLFNQAIIKAGGLNCPWGHQGSNKRPRVLFSRRFGKENELRNLMVDAMRSLSGWNILNVALRIAEDAMELQDKRFQVFCGPSLDYGEEDVFIPHSILYQKLMAKPVPLIAGITSQEGYMYILDKWQKYMEQGFGDMIKKDEQFIDFLKQNLAWGDLTACKHMDTIRRLYFPDLETMTAEEIEHHLASLCSDIWFRRFYDNFKLGPWGEFPSPFFVYKFSYLAPNTELRRTHCGQATRHILAPNHGDDQRFLYYAEYLMRKCAGEYLPDVEHVIRHMCSMWANFCRKGIPKSDHEDVVWKSHTEQEPCYLNIGKKSYLIQARLFEDRWQRLNEIVDGEPKVETPTTPLLHIPSIFDPFPSTIGEPWRMIDSDEEEASPSKAQIARGEGDEDVLVVEIHEAPQVI